MQFSVDRKRLLASLRDVKPALARNQLPVMESVLIAEADDGKLALTASDMELAITVKCEADITYHADPFCVPHKWLANLARKSVASTFTIASEVNENGATVVTVDDGAGRLSTIGYPCTDYPGGAERGGTLHVRDKNVLTIERNTLFALFESVGAHASRDETRPILNTVHLEADNEVCTAVATNSYCLGVAQMPCELRFKLTLPLRTFKPLLKGKRERFGMCIGEDKVTFRALDFALTTRQVDGSYPDYTQLLPGDEKYATTFKSSEMLAACEAAKNAGPKEAPMQMSFLNGNIRIIVEEPEAGVVFDTKVAHDHEGWDKRIGVNPTYLADAIRTCESEYVTIRTLTELRPFVLQPLSNKADTPPLALVMPIRLNEKEPYTGVVEREPVEVATPPKVDPREEECQHDCPACSHEEECNADAEAQAEREPEDLEPTVDVKVIATNPESGEVEVADAKLTGNTIHDARFSLSPEAIAKLAADVS